jgi:F-type H+-transporting ATPase subunit epsilon
VAEASEKTFDLSLVTPEGVAYEGEAQMLIVPGAAGEIGVLPRHAPLVAMLRAGETRIKADSEWTAFATGPGYFKVQRDRAIVLVDDAVRAEEIDVEQAHRGPTRRGPCWSGRTRARRASIAGSSPSA